MINDTMYARGAESSVIREIFTYANERKAQIGDENVFDFSLGNPSVPAPDEVSVRSSSHPSRCTGTRPRRAHPRFAPPWRNRSTVVLGRTTPWPMCS